MNNTPVKDFLRSLARLQPAKTVVRMPLGLIQFAGPNSLTKKPPHLMIKNVEHEGRACIWVKQELYLRLHCIPGFRRGQRAAWRGPIDGLRSSQDVRFPN